jgi:hypothetical protein
MKEYGTQQSAKRQVGLCAPPAFAPSVACNYKYLGFENINNLNNYI